MTERLQRLLDVFRSAEADVDASKKRLRDRSVAFLAELLKRSLTDRIAALNDARLTVLDRTELGRSIEESLPMKRIRIARSWTVPLRTIVQLARYHRRFLLRAGIAAAPIAYFGVGAWTATPKAAVPVEPTVDLNMQWIMPDGHLTEQRTFPAGTQAIWYPNGTHNVLCHWFPGSGYGTISDVPEDIFQSGKIIRR